jgi:hypothetical protein
MNDKNIIKLLLNNFANGTTLDIKGWSPIFYLVESSNYLCIEEYLNKFISVYYLSHPLLSLNSKNITPIELAIKKLNNTYNDLVNSVDNIMNEYIKQFTNLKVLPRNYDNLIKIAFDIVFNEDTQTQMFDVCNPDNYLNDDYYNKLDTNYNIETILNTDTTLVNDTKLIIKKLLKTSFKKLNKTIIENKFEKNNISDINNDLKKIINLRQIIGTRLAYSETKFKNKPNTENIFYKNLVVKHSIIVFGLFKKVYYQLIKKLFKIRMFDQSNPQILNKYFNNNGIITKLLIDCDYYVDDKLFKRGVSPNIDKENLLMRMIRTQFKIKSKLDQPDIINEDISYYMDIIVKKFIESGLISENSDIINDIYKINTIFINILKNYFTYSNILTDNLIRILNNIYQELKTIEIISININGLILN